MTVTGSPFLICFINRGMTDPLDIITFPYLVIAILVCDLEFPLEYDCATFSISAAIKNEFNVDSYIGLIKTSVIACGLFFELPIIIYFLTKLGLVTPVFLRKSWKYAVVIILVVAAIVTPPDVVSQVIVSIPMLVIYEASIQISKIVVKNQRIKDEQLS